MHIRILLPLPLLLATSLAHAQSAWPVPGTHADYGIVKIVTVSNPGIRHYCRVHDLTPDTIVCGIGAARKPVVYRRDDVAAILTHANHLGAHFIATIGVAAVATDLFIASIVLAPAVSLVIIASAITYGIYAAISPHPAWQNEKLLYQRPNTPLTIHLRSH